jgi:hypothetical protein
MALDMPCGARRDLDHIEAKLYRIRLRIYRICASKYIEKPDAEEKSPASGLFLFTSAPPGIPRR